MKKKDQNAISIHLDEKLLPLKQGEIGTEIDHVDVVLMLCTVHDTSLSES